MNTSFHESKIKYIFIPLLFTFFSSDLFGQDILWLHYFNRYKLSYKFSIDSDVGYRQYFDDNGGNRGQIRSGLRYDVSDRFYIRGGFMYVNGSRSNEEFRFYQDFVYNIPFNVFTLTQRVRFEEQFFENSKKKYRLRYNPSLKFSTFFGYCTLGCEPFFTLNDNNSKISSNRVYIGVTRRAYKNILITLQYINERSYSIPTEGYINESNMVRIKISHVIHPLKTGPLFKRNKV
ncbi:DUF2490 domain-containing protein [Flammeovirga pectinis]|uniref:DUF2490 domain-containing protein n=1 Tax=Flammeovirga pectinis TaxID=2494373 RepID=A0A3Q9FV54_9BACT|nr:DUF2490 domain-containing protein [Flammeovirga pectinis]AZQ65143.1 DUF2490 domain-containing protein [Flammeovirga pectinis]